MQSIIDATDELHVSFPNTGVLINPAKALPTGYERSPTQELDVVRFADGIVPVTTVLFDVAVTASDSKSGKGGGSLNV